MFYISAMFSADHIDDYYYSLFYFCVSVGNFEFYPAKNPPMNTQGKQIWGG